MSESGDRIDITPYIEILIRRKYLILTFCISAALTSLALTYVFSEKYLAYTTILYRPQEVTMWQNKQQVALGFPVPLAPIESIVNSLESIAKSRVVAQSVVSELKLDLDVEERDTNMILRLVDRSKKRIKETGNQVWQILKYGRIITSNKFDSAVEKVQDGLGVKPTRKAYTFRLEATNARADHAAGIVNTAARVLGDLLRRENLRVAQQERTAIEARISENDALIHRARKKVEEFKKKERISSLSEEISLQLKTIANFEEELNRTENEIRAEEKRRNEFRQQLANQEVLVKYLSTISDNPLVQELKVERARLEYQRAGLLEKFLPSHLEVKTIDAKLDNIRAKLSHEQEKIISSESQRLNEVYQKILIDVLNAESNLQGLAARHDALAAEVVDMKAAVKGLANKEAALAQLTLELSSTERAHMLLNDALEEARIAESKGVSGIVLLHEAAVPNAPEHPIKIAHVGLSAGLGLILAVAFVFFTNYLDPTLRTVWQVEKVVKLPLLATIPTLKGPDFE